MNPGVSPLTVYATLGLVVLGAGFLAARGHFGPFADDWLAGFAVAFGAAVLLRCVRAWALSDDPDD